MNYHIEIENLGAIEKAEFEISPMTILAGKNGTGKSFVTKFLYSVLKTFDEDIYLKEVEELSSVILLSIMKLLALINTNTEHSNTVTNVNDIFNELRELFKYSNNNDLYLNLVMNIDMLEKIKETYIDNINNPLKSIILSEMKNEIENNVRNPSIQIQASSQLFLKSMQDLLDVLHDKQSFEKKLSKKQLSNELKENFQISDLQQLVKFNTTQATFVIKDTIEIIIENNNLEINFLPKIDTIYSQNINNVTFFESPVYWKLLALINISNNDEILTGLPKHFNDLKELIFTKFKNNERPQFIIDCANNLEQSLQGKFRTTLGSDLVFENTQGQAIDKSLVSFGMTNLGILQAVLNKNIINKGSFIFIDEPESNLHPEWQTLLAETLVYLAQNGVYVIITSHSTDMLKAFDVATQEQKLQDKLSAHYFQMDGTLLAMNDEHLTKIEQARQKLMENYDDLTMRGYLL